jgi:hypothetical protein
MVHGFCPALGRRELVAGLVFGGAPSRRSCCCGTGRRLIPRHGIDLTPQPRDLEILRALWRYRFLLTSQIAREWWPGKSLYAAQKRLLRLTAAGWVTRFRPRLSRGKHEWVYELARRGFDLARIYCDEDGPFVPHEAKWRSRHVADYRVVEHDLQVSAWVMAYRRLARWIVVDWLGPDQGRIDVPKWYSERRYRPVGLEEVNREITDYTNAGDLRLEHFGAVVPDAMLPLYVDAEDREFDLLVEFDRTRRPVKNLDKLRRYDALLTAWWRLHNRYRGATEPPSVLFVCPDEDAVFGLMRAADRELTGRLSTPGQRPDDWPPAGDDPRDFFARETRLLGDAE